MNKNILLFLLLSLPFSTLAQDTLWRETIPNNQQWTAEIQKNKTSTYNPDLGVLLTHNESILHISDFTGGLFRQYEDTTAIPVEIQFIANNIIPLTIETPYGPCKISGYWDAQTGTLTLHWAIDFNKIKETSVFTFSKY
jgi:hypothetical protein